METFCLELLRAWVAQGIEATLYVSYHGGDRERDIPVSVERVCWDIRAMYSFFKLARWLRKRPKDSCLALSQELAVVLLILKKLHLIRNRIYFRESSDVVKHYGIRFKCIMRWLWPSLNGIIEQSHSGREETEKICNCQMSQCLIVRNMMPTPCKTGILWEINQSVRLACIGSFKSMKGQTFLINELKDDKASDWVLTFWGDGERKRETEQLVYKLNMFDRTHFNAWQCDKRMIYESCDIVVIPSDYEGLPNVMLEAILHGKRVSVRPTCVGACELLSELGISGTWPWRESLKIPQAIWDNARSKLSEICNPVKISREILDFITH